MSTLIVAFPKLEEAKAVRSLLIHRGFDVAVPCTSGAQAINQADTLSDGIIICGYKLSDNMVYTELYEYKPKSESRWYSAAKFRRRRLEKEQMGRLSGQWNCMCGNANKG
jgi:gamma-glutamyl-gamma-aminobutyrate hydrolase PuuD